MSGNTHESFAWKIPHKHHTQDEPGETPETPQDPLRLGILISGSGSNLQALIDASESKQLPGVEIALVVSNNAHAYGVQRALKHGVPVIYLPWARNGGAHFLVPEVRLATLLQLFHVDLIVLAGWM